MTYVKKILIVFCFFILSQIGLTIFSFPLIGLPQIEPLWVCLITISTILLSLWIAWKIKIITFDLKWITKRNLLYIIGGTISLTIISFIMSLLIQIINGESTTTNEVLIQTIFSDANPYLLFLLIAISGPIIEEFIFRGGIIGYIFKDYPKIGLVSSSILFGALHQASDPLNFLLYFLMGFCLGFCYLKTKRIEVSIAIHFINNAMAALAMIFLL